jgi:hypothetical protein
MKGWQIALLTLISIIVIVIIILEFLGLRCDCKGNCKCIAQCNCSGGCRCKHVGKARETFVDVADTEGPARLTPYAACEIRAVRQGSYVDNVCAAYKNMVKPLLDSLENDIPTYNKIVKAYNDALVNNIVPRTGQSYTQQYSELLNAFIAFEQTAFNILSAADKSIPESYSFIIPDPIAVVDYAPGIATWEPAASQAKSYKCGAFSVSDQDSLNRLRGRANRAGAANAQQLFSKAQRNICASKGYFYNDGTFIDKGCDATCEGCCIPSAEELPGPAAASACPKPKVRPFRIPARQIRLRVVSPSVKKVLSECFTTQEGARDIQQVLKSEKFLSLQLPPINHPTQ